MKLSTKLVRFLLLFEKNDELPEGSDEDFAGFKKVWDEYAGGDDERFAIGATLIVNSELEEGDMAGLTEAVLAALKHEANFESSWAINEAFAAAIKKLGCAEKVFQTMAEVADDPTEAYSSLLDELGKLKVAVPTDEGWTELKPKKEEELKPATPKKKGGKKKTKK